MSSEFDKILFFCYYHMMRERTEINKYLCSLARGVVLFRNTVAQCWSGRAVRLSNGDVVVQEARSLHAGLCNGSSDLIGWESITVTPEMVGTQIARFLAVELKTGRVPLTPQQRHFIDMVNNAGGRAFVERVSAQERIKS